MIPQNDYLHIEPIEKETTKSGIYIGEDKQYENVGHAKVTAVSSKITDITPGEHILYDKRGTTPSGHRDEIFIRYEDVHGVVPEGATVE